jgi:hypothetical protein
MRRTLDQSWARHCIMILVMTMLVTASGLGTFAHALADCHGTASATDGGAVHAHGHGVDHDHRHEQYDAAADKIAIDAVAPGTAAAHDQSPDGQTSAHLDCCGHLCQAVDTSRVVALSAPAFAAQLFPLMLHGLGPDAPARSMERPPSMTAEI